MLLEFVRSSPNDGDLGGDACCHFVEQPGLAVAHGIPRQGQLTHGPRTTTTRLQLLPEARRFAPPKAHPPRPRSGIVGRAVTDCPGECLVSAKRGGIEWVRARLFPTHAGKRVWGTGRGVQPTMVPLAVSWKRTTPVSLTAESVTWKDFVPLPGRCGHTGMLIVFIRVPAMNFRVPDFLPPKSPPPAAVELYERAVRRHGVVHGEGSRCRHREGDGQVELRRSSVRGGGSCASPIPRLGAPIPTSSLRIVPVAVLCRSW